MEAIARDISESADEAPGMRLTVGERALLHLLTQEGRGDEYQAPLETTHQGIAACLGISRSHASIETRKLLDRQQVEMLFRHVSGGPRMKTYHLTESGYLAAAKLRASVESSGCDVGMLIASPLPSKRLTPADLQSEIRAIRERMELDRGRLDRLEASVAEVF